MARQVFSVNQKFSFLRSKYTSTNRAEYGCLPVLSKLPFKGIFIFGTLLNSAENSEIVWQLPLVSHEIWHASLFDLIVNYSLFLSQYTTTFKLPIQVCFSHAGGSINFDPVPHFRRHGW